MKKTSILILILASLAGTATAQNSASIYFRKANGDTVFLNSFAGKKTLFIIAPLSQGDSVFAQLQTFKARYHDTVRIVCLLSIEDGFQNSNLSSITTLFSSMGAILTQGMYTRKSAGVNQSLLLQWLTDKTKNSHFNMDVQGVGQKFFVNESGRLYAVFPPQASLSIPIIDKVVHSTVQ